MIPEKATWPHTARMRARDKTPGVSGYPHDGQGLAQAHAALTTRRRARHRVSYAKRAGVVATEFALTLPLLLLIALGCVDFGRVGYYAITVANAAGAGAQNAATHRVTPYTSATWQQEIHDIVEEELAAAPGFDPELLTVLVSSVEEVDGDLRVSVEARYPFETIVDWPGLPNSVELSKSVEFRQFR